MTDPVERLGSPGGDEWRPVPLRTDRVALEPIGPQHYEFLRRAEVTALGPTWRHRGVVQSPEAFTQALWSGVLCQYIAVRRAKGSPLGWFQCYNADQGAGTAFVSAGRFSRAGSLDLTFHEAAWVFFEHVFDCWPMRKLVLEVPAFNLSRIESGIGDLFQIEGRLTEMVWAGGRYWDLVLVTLERDAWQRSDRVAYIRARAIRRSAKGNGSGRSEKEKPLASSTSPVTMT